MVHITDESPLAEPPAAAQSGTDCLHILKALLSGLNDERILTYVHQWATRKARNELGCILSVTCVSDPIAINGYKRRCTGSQMLAVKNSCI